MYKSKFIWLSVIIVLAVLLFQFRPKSRNEGQYYVLEPVRFVYKPNGPPEAAAIIHGRTINETELLERSPVLTDLNKQEQTMLEEAVAKLTSGKTKVVPDGKTFSRENLNLNQVQYSLIKRRQFNEKLSVLRDLLVNQLLFGSAKSEGVSLEKFIAEKILKGADQAQRNVLINEYVRKHYDEKGEIFFLPPNYVFPVNESKMVIGPKDPGATPIVVFSNLQCGPCLQLASELLAFKKKYKEQIRIGFINFFTPEDWRSRLIAEATFCLNAQKYDYFWSFFEMISPMTKPVDEATIYETVKKTEADFEVFRSCLLRQQYKDEVTAQLKYSSDFGVIMMPTVIIGSQVFAGSVKLSDLENALLEPKN